MPHPKFVCLAVLLWLAAACTSSTESKPARDGGFGRDAGASLPRDAGFETTRDGGIVSRTDAGNIDAGDQPLDGGFPFTGCPGTGAAFATYNDFWSAFDETYALFDLRLPNGDWNEIGRAGCAQLSAGMSEQALFDVLVTMAESFDDGHVQLSSPGGLEGDGWVNEYPYYDEVASLEGNIESEYIDEDEFTWAAEDWFAWGSIGNVGYVSITSLDGLSTSEDEDDDRAAANAAMQSVLADLGSLDAMVIDVRANEGGWDTVALDVARYFAGARTLTWSKRRRNGPAHDDFGPWEDQNVEAAHANAFAGPVILLTSRGTFSAAETFTLAMRVRDNVTILGEPGSGHFSDLVDATVPNGWSLELSGEQYRAADGMIYETRGVPVDVNVPLDLTALSTGRDAQLESALMMLGN